MISLLYQREAIRECLYTLTSMAALKAFQIWPLNALTRVEQPRQKLAVEWLWISDTGIEGNDR